MSKQERVRAVVELLHEPTSVDTIAGRAEVSQRIAAHELERLSNEGLVITTQVRGQKTYDVSESHLFNEMVQELVKENSRKELKSQLEQLASKRREITVEFSEAELQDNPNVQATMEAIETDSELIHHALRRYKQSN
ncbi:hypothetical protein [Haladaptatus sp. YSMS36]|uniref:DUF7342 family protein n=1 Tax=Haladaptatus sp. YSMS36 TaxID=3033384 RepID=UPI0023E8DF23|nr:hypothetical protein [Haladaptatus sp. YSMS36]